MKAEFPDCFQFLFEPARYKVAYGGRGSGKSVSVAKALLIMAAQKPLRILCARELQVSIKDSVHKLLVDEIAGMPQLAGFYEVQNSVILGRNGSEFMFKGLRHNVTEVKSMQGIDICWVEEAQMVSKSSWETLIPTIRKDGSEIWLTFNPLLEEDETYQRFVINPPPGSIVRKVNWNDNPFFPKVLHDEMVHLKSKDPDSWLNVYEGHCRQTLDGAVYANEIREATEEGRVTKVPYDPTKPVDTFFDLGWADHTCIWFAQAVGFEYHLIDYHSDSQRSINHYLEVLQDKRYVYGKDWLPHDAQAKQLGSGKSIEEILRAAGRKVYIVPRLSLEDGINAARTVFPNCWFDQEKCADGIQALRHYRYEVDEENGTLKRKPIHDWASHGADAFRYMCVSIKPKPDVSADKYRRGRRGGGRAGSWQSA
jgi:phage terminase large subunit